MTNSLAAEITRAPVPHDRARADDVIRGLPDPLRSGAIGELAHGAAGSSPFLARLLECHGPWLAGAIARPTQEALDDLIAEATQAGESADWRGLLSALRLARTRAALLIALADLGGVWDLGPVTRALSDLADALSSTALRWLIAKEITRGKIPGMSEDNIPGGAGLSVIAMGKLGARELNYSSDIDLICLFDQSQLPPDDHGEARARYIHITRQMVRALSDRTPEGYVFRTDLRLRPAPSTTALCLSMDAAEHYYETVGRTWERAAHIKARPVAGDITAGRAYLRRLSSFVWRRNLDFAAIEDIEDILRKIREKEGRFHPSSVPGYDIKLGPGGIREIELFAQTRQLIMGGRLPVLRDPTTLGALAALRDEGVIGAEMCAALSQAYVAHRTVEHRLQMVQDRQTQTIPVNEEARAEVAALDGWSDPRAWEADIAERLATVHDVTKEFFDAAGRLPSEPAQARTDAQSIAAHGFTRPDDVSRTLHRWHSGGIAATSTERGQRLYAALEADLIGMLGSADSPDDAIAAFDRFLSGLPAGVQVFSLLKANRHLLRLVIDILATAPRLASHLGQEPETLDIILAEDFFQKPPTQEWLEADLHIWIGETTDYEHVLDISRRWARELKFRISVQVLSGMIDEVTAGEAFSAIAEAALQTLMPFVTDNFTARHGPPPGRGMAVVAMGKLGTREMTARSDLDLITVYDAGDAGDAEPPQGGRALPPQVYYARLTQALISALTAPTAEGRLYAVDMRLRPSGRQGPITVSLGSFEHYQTGQAWVWEHLALTRARVVCGEDSLAADTGAVIGAALAGRRRDARVLSEAGEMRARLISAHRRERGRPWALKHAAGGLMEIEFLAQTGGLFHGLGPGRPARDMLGPLAEAGWISPDEARALADALVLQTRLQHIDCVALEQPFDPENAGKRLRRVMAEAGGSADFDGLSEKLRGAQAAAARVCARVQDGDSGTA